MYSSRDSASVFKEFFKARLSLLRDHASLYPSVLLFVASESYCEAALKSIRSSGLFANEWGIVFISLGFSLNICEHKFDRARIISLEIDFPFDIIKVELKGEPVSPIEIRSKK